MQQISQFVKTKHKNLKLTQEEVAQRSDVGLRFLRELEQGKTTLKLDKINQVLDMFSSEVGVIRKTYDDV